jgi:hypothetical protein
MIRRLDKQVDAIQLQLVTIRDLALEVAGDRRVQRQASWLMAAGRIAGSAAEAVQQHRRRVTPCLRRKRVRLLVRPTSSYRSSATACCTCRTDQSRWIPSFARADCPHRSRSGGT